MEAGEEGVRALAEQAAGLLLDLGYVEPLSCVDTLIHSCVLGASCQEFTSLCVWLVSQLKSVSSLVDNVCPTEGPADAETFQLEMSGVLSELHCPYTSLTTGDVTLRLTNANNCLLLIVFLSTELQAARTLTRRMATAPDPGRLAKEALCELRLIWEALGLPEPSLDIPVAEHMSLLEKKICDVSATIPNSQLSPLLKVPLLPAQWGKLIELHRSLLTEYECRMRMLFTRFDVTVQSFHWSERAKEKGRAMQDVLGPLSKSLHTESCVTLSHLLAARENDSQIVQTCNATFCQNTRSTIHKVLMVGNVPDRGGRPNEIEPPMPSWEKRREGGGGQRNWGKSNKKRKR
ncbi:protein FAM98C [Pelobates fuscus]|uniref:protein FAM98C n=1 Tax=Pelobates fuscus TaxID=191477 RepID=UPI002FE481B1